MADTGVFLLKLLGLSLLLSVGIKYGGPFLPIPATSGVALGVVLGVPLLFLGFLLRSPR